MRLQGLQLLQQLVRSQGSCQSQWRSGLQRCASSLLQTGSTSSAVPTALAWHGFRAAYSQEAAAPTEVNPAAEAAASAVDKGDTKPSTTSSSTSIESVPAGGMAPLADSSASSKGPNTPSSSSSSNSGGGGSNRRSSNTDGSGSQPQKDQRQGQQRTRNGSGGFAGKQGSSQSRSSREAANSSGMGRPRSAAERALQELSGRLHMAEAHGQYQTIIAAFDRYLDAHWAEDRLAPEYLPSHQSKLYNKYKTAMCRRPNWITVARLQRCKALDQQYGKEEHVQRTDILRMLLHQHKGNHTQALAIFRQLWDDRVVLLAGREVEVGLQAAYRCNDVELVQEVLETIRARRYLITMSQLGQLLKGALRFLAITAIQQNDLKALQRHVQALGDLLYATTSSSGGGSGGESDKRVHEDHYIFQDLIAAAADADNHAVARELLKVVDNTFRERGADGKAVPVKFPQGLLLSVLNCCARTGASSTAAQVVWPILQRCLQQPPYGKSGKQEQAGQWKPQQPSAAAYHALIEAHMRDGYLEPALEAMVELEAAHGEDDPQAASVYGGLRFCIDLISDEAKVVQLFNAVTKRQEQKQVITNSMFNLLVRAVARSSSAEDTATIWSSMPAYGLTPDADSYNAVIENLGIVKRTLPMLRIMETMQQQHDRLQAAAAADASAGAVKVDCQPNAATFQLVIEAMLDSKDLVALDDVLHRLRRAGIAHKLPHSLLERARRGDRSAGRGIARSGSRAAASSSSSSSSSQYRPSGTSSDEEQAGGGSSGSGSSRTKWAWKPSPQSADGSSSSSSSAAVASSSAAQGQAALSALRKKFRAHSQAAAGTGNGSSSEAGAAATPGAAAPSSQDDGVGDAGPAQELDSLAAAIKGGMK